MLTEKFKNLTAQQQEKVNIIKDKSEMMEFINENGIELTKEEESELSMYFETGSVELSDDELDTVAGGFDKAAKEEAKLEKYRQMGIADGRLTKFNVRRNCMCKCSNEYKYARNFESYTWTFYDVKCYNCGMTADKIKD